MYFFIGPVVASLIVAAITSRRGRPGGWAIFGIYAVCIVLVGTASHVISTYREQERALAAMDADPMFAAIKVSDPAVYADMRKVVSDIAEVPAARRKQEMERRLSPLIQQVVAEKAHNLNDEMVIETARLSNDILRARLKTDPLACETQKEFMSSTNADRPEAMAVIANSVGAERFRKYMVDILTSSPASEHRPVAPSSDLRSVVAAMIPTLAARQNMTIEQLAASLQTREGKCRFAPEIVDAVLALPTVQAADALRSVDPSRM